MKRQVATVAAVFLVATAPALVLAYGEASAAAPASPDAVPDSAFQPVATQRPEARAQLALERAASAAPIQLDPALLGPTVAPAPRALAAIPATQPVVIAMATPRPLIALPQGPTGGTTVADARAYAESRIGSAQYSCLDALWTRESNWNPYATNASSGAYGIPQALPGDKMAIFGADWRTNPVTQVKWGLSYIAGRYGTACNAWAHSQQDGWY